MEFKDVVEKEFEKKIKCLRNDNGGEYMLEDFFKYCDKNKITRQMTCSDTPQQNGVVERKLAYLASISLSWLHDKSLPGELWAEAIQCVMSEIHIYLPLRLHMVKNQMLIIFEYLVLSVMFMFQNLIKLNLI